MLSARRGRLASLFRASASCHCALASAFLLLAFVALRSTLPPASLVAHAAPAAHGASHPTPAVVLRPAAASAEAAWALGGALGSDAGELARPEALPARLRATLEPLLGLCVETFLEGASPGLGALLSGDAHIARSRGAASVGCFFGKSVDLPVSACAVRICPIMHVLPSMHNAWCSCVSAYTYAPHYKPNILK